MKRKRFLGILLSLALALGLMLGMSMTAYADTPYADFVNTTKTVKFNDADWYIIADDSTAEDAGTVTLFAKEPITTTSFNKGGTDNAYSASLVKINLDSMTTTGSYAKVADAIVATDLDDVHVTGAKLWLLSETEFEALNASIKPCTEFKSKLESLSSKLDAAVLWWLRTPGDTTSDSATAKAAPYDGGALTSQTVKTICAVRPALKLDLSKVDFISESDTYTFALKSAVRSVSLDKDSITLAMDGVKTEKLTATITPETATDQSVTWTSDKPAVAKVDSEGNVTAVAAGTATITATSNSDSTKTATCDVKVTMPPVSYIDDDGSEKECTIYTKVESGNKQQQWGYWGNNTTTTWYVVDKDVTISNGAVVTNGDVRLILCDGAKLTIVDKGILVYGQFTVYGQSSGTGQIKTNGKTYYGINSNPAGLVRGAITINGGTVNVSGSDYGIFYQRTNTNDKGTAFTINGGTLIAKNTNSGIKGGAVTINGGTVTASASGASGYGIYSSEDLAINGGEVTATVTGTNSMGILSYKNLTIENGKVTAKGTNSVGRGIQAFGDITIDGGTVNVESTQSDALYGKLTVTGGDVTITGGNVAISGTVKNSISGTGWTDTAGTAGEANIAISDEARKLSPYRKVKFEHAHSFTYAGEGATITATCATGCTLTDGKVELTIVKPTLTTYGQTGDDISAEATLDGLDDFNAATGKKIEATEIKYYKATKNDSDYTKGDALESAPTNAGDYIAEITLSDVKTDEGDNQSVTAFVGYTIAQRPVTVSGITASDKTYDGDTTATLVTSAVIFNGKLDGDTLTVSATVEFDDANVGENKTVTISDLALDGDSKDNYILAPEDQQTGTTANITTKEVGLTWSNTELTYNGQAQKPTATATGLVGDDTCTVTVTGEQTDVGEDYTATADSLSNGNYKLPDENKTTTFKIIKADAVAAAVTANSRTYDGTEKTLVTVDDSTLEGGTMQYVLGTNGETAPNDGWAKDIPTATEAGTYYVWYKVVGDENHNDAEPKCVSAPIVKDDAEPEVSEDALTYNGKEQALVKAGDVKGGEMQYALGKDATTAPTGGWSADIPTAKDAGTYYVWYYVQGDKNHNDTAKAALTVEIAPKPATVTIDAKTKTYGDADPELTYKAEGLVDGDSLNVTLKRDPGENVGGYRISADEADGNYKLAFKEASLTIEARNATITAADQTITEGEAVQTGVDQAKLTELAAGDALDSVTLTGDEGAGTITPSAAKIVNAEGKDVTDNYNITYAAGKLTVNPKPAEPETPTEPETPIQLPADPDYTLLAAAKTSGKTAVKMTWTKVADAEGYDIFFAECGGKSNYALVATVKAGTQSYKITGLKKKTSYKGYVVAWKTVNGEKTTIGSASPVVHVITGGYKGKQTNASKVTVKTSKVTLAVGKTSAIKASASKQKSGKKLVAHVNALRYYSSNRNVATVSSSGKIKAVGVGSCTIYVLANNGVRTSVKVTVTDAPTKVAFKKSSYSVKKGKKLNLGKQVKLTPSGVSSALAWSSSNKKIATVSASGVVKGVKKGTVTITVKTANGKKAKVKVKVK